MDEDIRHLLAAGEVAAAFERVVERYGEKVFRLAYSFVLSETAAEDLAQDVLVKIWRALPGFKGSASLSSWIYTITRNTCFTALKRRRPTVSLSEPDVREALEALPELQQERAGGAPVLDVDFLLRQLPANYRQVITLFYLEQRSYEDTAEALGIPLGTVKTYLHRARKELSRLAERSDARVPFGAELQ